MTYELPERLSTRWGRQEWLREAKRQLEQERAAEAKPVPRARAPRLRDAKRRMEEELWVEQPANAAYEAWRAHGGRAFGKVTPYRPPDRPAGQINVTDPDSRIVQSRHGFIQGYTAQAVTTKDQIVICADVICGGNERMSLERLVAGAERELDPAGVSAAVEVALADAGFWNTDQITRLTDRGIKTLVNPDSAGRKSPAHRTGNADSTTWRCASS